MNGDVRRTFEMVARSVNFCDAQPDTDAGHWCRWSGSSREGAMEQVAAMQRAGLIDVHTGAVGKRRLRREMLAGPIAHLAEVGGLAGRDHPDLVSKFRYKPSGSRTSRTGPPRAAMQARSHTNNGVPAQYSMRGSAGGVTGRRWTSSPRP